MSNSFQPSPPSPQAIPPPSPQILPEATISITPAQSAFDQTTNNLLKLGSLTMNKFAQDPSEELDGFDIPLVDPANPNAAGYYLGDTTASRHTGKDEEESDEIPNVPPAEAIRYLREVVQREFGTTSTELIKYEYLDEFEQNRKSCILTITRPNGLSRSYRTKAEFARKSEAKLSAATSAIQLGAVRFIKHGETSKIVGKRGLVLAKLDAGAKKDESDAKGENKTANPEASADAVEQGDLAVAQIEDCCSEWRAGSVVPKWVYMVEQKLPNAFGCALKISLSTNIQRAYSVLVSVDYPQKSMAKAACARIALEQDVLGFIKHGDGLEHPIFVPFVGAEAIPPPLPPSVTTLQAFHAALPKPMPDHIGTKSNGEINAVAWLNTMVQIAKGSRMMVTFTWHTDAKLGLHGCLLRLSRPDAPSQSYLVEAIFSKRADAKLAVCLLACSQGVGNFVRALAVEIEARVTTEMRRRCAEILPAIGQALNKFRHGSRPDFNYNCDLATFGCTLTIDLSSDSENEIKRQWKVPLAYKSKADAKIAVACAAADSGIFEFVKNRGNTPPSNENSAEGELLVEAIELEEGETTLEGGKKKKKKKAKKDVAEGDGEGADVVEGAGKKNDESEVPLFETREEALARGRSDAAKRRQKRPLNNMGRGGIFGRPPFRGGFGGNARGMISRPGFGADRNHSHLFGAPPGFVPPGRPLPPGVPHPAPLPFHQQNSYASRSYGLGYPGGTYSSEYQQRDHGYLYRDPGLAHGRHASGPGGAAADAETPFAHAPPPAPPPHVAPGYHERAGDYDYGREREYRQGPYAPPPFSGAVPPPGPAVPSGAPYGYEYPHHAAPVPPPPPQYRQTVATDYHPYEREKYAGRPAQGVSRAYEPEHYAPDYDRIPDRGAQHEPLPPPPHVSPRLPLHAQGSHSSPSHSHSSHSHSSVASVSVHPPPPPPPQHSNPRPYGYDASQLPPPLHVEHHAAAPRAMYDRPVALDVPHNEAARGRSVYERTAALAPTQPRQTPRLPTQPAASAKIEEKLDSVISRLEKEANDKVVDAPQSLTTRQSHPRGTSNGRGRPSQLPSPTSARKPSLSHGTHESSNHDTRQSSVDQNPAVPSKRGRSSGWEDQDSPSSKRMRGHSRSMSRASERGRSRDGRGRERSVPPSGREKGVHPENGGNELEKSVPPPNVPKDDGEEKKKKKGLKRGRESSPSGQKRKGSEQKQKSYVAALYDHCAKEGMSRPELCHEEITSDEGDKKFKVWIVMGKERLELPTSFPSLTVGQERVAKSVLGRLRVQTKKRKEA